MRCQAADIRALKNALNRQLGGQYPAHFRAQANRQQRVTAELKEVGAHTYLLCRKFQ